MPSVYADFVIILSYKTAKNIDEYQYCSYKTNEAAKLGSLIFRYF